MKRKKQWILGLITRLHSCVWQCQLWEVPSGSRTAVLMPLMDGEWYRSHRMKMKMNVWMIIHLHLLGPWQETFHHRLPGPGYVDLMDPAVLSLCRSLQTVMLHLPCEFSLVLCMVMDGQMQPLLPHLTYRHLTSHLPMHALCLLRVE